MDWRSTLPIAGFGVLAVTGLYYFLRPKKEDPAALERERRAYLNRVGRIVEGHVVEVQDGKSSPAPHFRAVEVPIPTSSAASETKSAAAAAAKISLETRS